MIIRVAAAAGIILFNSAVTLAAAEGNSISNLGGRWAGAGTVQFTNGQTQPYKCTITNFLSENDTRVKQTLRCRTADDNKLEIASFIQVAGNAITGTWEEQQNSLTGTLRGKVTPTGYQATAHNSFFQASFEIAVISRCEQQVTIRPSRDIALISATLKKC